MDLSLFSPAGPEFLFGWIHFLAGITWIGLLYYFNFVQAPFMAEAPAEAKPGVTRLLLPRAMWWFRWGAVFTFLSGLAIIIWRILGIHDSGTGVVMEPNMAVMSTSWGVGISLGALLGTIMFLNVWLVIWPNQKIVIGSAETVFKGGTADPKVPDAAARAFLASRTNTLFSIPMLFFMGNHRLSFFTGEPKMSVGIPLGICALVIALFEGIALFGKKGAGPAKMLDKHIAVIHIGLVLALLFYFVVDGLL